ncbi:MAG: FAD synthase [Candidatus Magasanikbacteria bacterium CG10_big_fil_rev_8_21_14_0_10_36_16]|uniref:FAD synthase n=1 Tax=Candidatus Magasanikbacteria bacterium CG10_big_fil_rev_8_21_14_0_10_36_16 TaxID=1974645 RepID=A0A2H0TYV9_9BACT|nr:MAG: FAD synthase [Candidatus Magasanikbacteria bacterium CG10_big_fil_rev_8_21_14_0_10_36_16]
MKKVMVFGTFDIVHLGHLNLFRQARKLGDYLVVVVARDKTSKKIKNITLVNNEKERLEFLKNIKSIDQAILGDKIDYYKVIKTEKPDVIALGYDQDNFIDKLEDKIKEFKLNTKVVRMKSHKPEQHKSGNIRKKISRML